MKRLFAAALIFFIIFPFFAIADVIILKNGKQIKSEEVWEEGNQVKCYLFGQIVGYPKETVKQIKSEEGEATSESESEGNLLGSREKAEADLKRALKNGSIPNFLGEEREIEIRMNAYDMLLSLPQNDLKELISEYYPDFSSILKEHRLKSAKATSPKPKKAQSAKFTGVKALWTNALTDAKKDQAIQSGLVIECVLRLTG
jgi:hypothetical protein